MTTDEEYMRICLDLATNGVRSSMPNPSVGAVVVCDDQIIGKGCTSPYGGPHAEVNAINSVSDKAKLNQSTLYVSLEPCSHYGKTPPCSDLIIASEIPKVVIGCTDPFKQVNGSGIAKLKNAGIEVVCEVLEKECRQLNRRFFTFHEEKRPYIILKWAQSADGFIDPRRATGEKGIRWITDPKTKELTHAWRSREMAIAIGTNTAITDNPSLTVRAVEGLNPLRIVVDRDGKLPADLNLFDGEAQSLVFTGSEHRDYPNAEAVKINFDDFIEEFFCTLYERNILSVIIEGGARFLSSFITANAWDEARVLTGKIAFKDGLKAPEIGQTPSFTKVENGDVINFYHNA